MGHLRRTAQTKRPCIFDVVLTRAAHRAASPDIRRPRRVEVIARREGLVLFSVGRPSSALPYASCA